MALRGRIERWFEFGERGATWRGEITGGATTFLTMADVVFVQPALLYLRPPRLAATHFCEQSNMTHID
jgi:xanthine/uracil/vitamin C permease (AzgA family)